MEKSVIMKAEAFKRLGTSVISDVLDKLGIRGCIHGIHAQSGGGLICGPAFPVRYEPEDGKGGSLGDFVGQVEAGQVLVLDNYGRTDCTVWGGLTSAYAAVHGFEATVINGVFRDSDAVRASGYNIFSKGTCMTTGKGRTKCVATNEPICINDVQINPGDYMLGDGDGLLCIPASRADEVLKIAEELNEADIAAENAVKNGMYLAEAVKTFGRGKKK